jgi:DNA polymerase III subunit gamma/tau
MARFLDKYRPRQFSEYLDIDRLASVITSIVEGNQWHGILIVGEHGMGKSTLARLLINRLICASPNGIEPCRHCPMCEDFIPEGDNAYMERNVKGGSHMTRGWAENLIGDMPKLSMFHPRYVFVDDVDNAPPGHLEALQLPFDCHSDSAMIFTATHLDRLPEPFRQRMKTIRVRKPEGLVLSQFVTRLCKLEGISVVEEGAVPRLVTMANRNYRNILNALESIRDNGKFLSLGSLEEEYVLDNLGLQVGEKRFVAVTAPACAKGGI